MGSLIFTGDIFWDWIRSFLSWIDVVFYGAITWFFQTLFIIANFQLDVFYEDIQRNVYVILGIFMLFKLLFSFLSYLVNPDKMNDKEQGMGKLISRIIVVFVMLLALPTAFDVLTELQNRLLPVVPRIITGYNMASGDYFDEGTGNIDVAGIADNMSLTIYRSFVRSSGLCEEEDDSSSWQSVEDAREDINKKCGGTFGNKYYVYKYTPIIPFLVAIAMLYVLISLNIDIAIRAFQIIILKSMAPIPIISYVDPKSSKDGMFSKWTKMLLSTWGRLFINLGLIYFIIYLLSMIFTAEFWNQTLGSISAGGDPITTTLVLVFVIVGLLFFARQAPKFVLDALGIKSQGNFTRMLGMGATALSGLGAGVRAGKTAYDRGNGLAITRGIMGGLGSIAAGGNALMVSDKPKLNTGLIESKKYQAQNLYNIRSGYGIGKKLLGGVESVFGYDIDSDINHTQSIIDTSKQLKEYTMAEGAKYYSDVGIDLKDSSNNIITNASRNQLLAAVAQSRATGGDVILNNQNLGSADGSLVSKLLGDVNEEVGSRYIEGVNDGTIKTVANWNDDQYKTAATKLNAFTTSYANSTNQTVEDAKQDRIPQIKKNQKSNETKLFTLKQKKGPSRQ